MEAIEFDADLYKLISSTDEDIYIEYDGCDDDDMWLRMEDEKAIPLVSSIWWKYI